jgi:hypothetical protein
MFDDCRTILLLLPHHHDTSKTFPNGGSIKEVAEYQNPATSLSGALTVKLPAPFKTDLLLH